jgi:DNA polymerase III epsilon subunit-like protein
MRGMPSKERREVFISVDIEASGPTPGIGSMLSIGACVIDDPDVGIYLELKPLPDQTWDKQAEKVHRLEKDHLEEFGLEPDDAMRQFDAWVTAAADGAWPVFVGFNAPFDWMFVADYFWRYVGRNPFGISALDLKSYYMALIGTDRWEDTRRVNIDDRLKLEPDHSHQALEDARGQAALARELFKRAKPR